MNRARIAHGKSAAWLLLIIGMILPSAGCVALATAAYVLKGTNVDAEYTGFKGKRVAVICRPVADLQYSNADVARQLAKEVSRRLRAMVRKIDVIDQQEVEAWLDENVWENYPEVGEALEAEMVLAIDLEAFSIYQGQTLYQGRSNVSMTVYNLETGEIDYEKSMPETIYPPNVGIATSDRQEAAFRSEFIDELAEAIGRHFYAHDTRIDFAKDAAAFQH